MKYFFLSIISLFVFIPAIAFAGDKYGLQATAGEAGLNTQQGSVSDVAGNVIGAGLTLIGVLFFMLMIYAGITWMLARGNEEQSKKALNTITAAIIGLVLVIASYAITQFVFQSVSGQQTSGGPGAPATTAPAAGRCVLRPEPNPAAQGFCDLFTFQVTCNRADVNADGTFDCQWQ